ncbi:MAG: ribonuclease HII [Candidatus Moranbacteria bacterium]|nr:ribonuclease HII [Candidatus Moranbacteria bacterium]
MMTKQNASSFDLEKKLLTKGYVFVIGTDEAGRGPLAGPVVAAAAIYRGANFEIPEEKKKLMDFVRDSKTVSHKKREELFDFIHENFYIGVGMCDHKTIDEINILEASFLSMKKALSDLKTKFRHEMPNFDNNIILVDGNKKIPNLSLYQEAVIGGDRISKSISAASIIAKVMRDRLMLEMHEKYPQYGFDKHKGYGTKLHMDALQQFGPCEIHRQTFEPMPSLAKNSKR